MQEQRLLPATLHHALSGQQCKTATCLLKKTHALCLHTHWQLEAVMPTEPAAGTLPFWKAAALVTIAVSNTPLSSSDSTLLWACWHLNRGTSNRQCQVACVTTVNMVLQLQQQTS
jgi:hypothetical protein